MVEVRPEESFERYLELPVEELLGRLASVTSQIAKITHLVGRAKTAQLEAKSRGWAYSQESTVKGRERSADIEAAPATTELYENQSYMYSLIEERDFLKFLISTRTALVTT